MQHPEVRLPSFSPLWSLWSLWFNAFDLGPRDAQDFIERGHAVANPSQAVVPQPNHPMLNRVRADHALLHRVVNEVAQRVVGGEQFVDAGAALVPGEVARAAAHRAIEALGGGVAEDRARGGVGLVGRLALGAGLAYQPPRGHAVP